MDNNKKYYLFLDDVRVPTQVKWVDLPLIDPNSWIIVRNYNEFCEMILKNNLPEFICFDHDLSTEHYDVNTDPNTYKEKTGYDCAKWLIEYCRINKLEVPKYLVHSLNPIGAENISRYIENYKRVSKEFNFF